MKYIFLIFIFLFYWGTLFSQTSQNKTNSFYLYFEFGKDVLTAKSKAELTTFLKMAKKYTMEVEIITFCDTIGSIEYNQALSDMRLAAMDKIFTEQNIPILKKESRGENLDGYIIKEKQNSMQRTTLITYSKKSMEVDVANRFSEVLTIKDKSNIKPIILDIQFEGGTPIVLSKSLSEIDALYTFMNANKNVKALIRGHVCCENDLTLSTQRADEVYQRLIRKGIDPSRLDFKGYSNTLPVVSPEITEEDRQKNRRVDVVFHVEEE